MKTFLPIAQIIISILLIASIILQQRGTALGSAFGAEGGSFYATRRGLQKKLFWSTVVLGSLFIIFALLSLIS